MESIEEEIKTSFVPLFIILKQQQLVNLVLLTIRPVELVVHGSVNLIVEVLLNYFHLLPKHVSELEEMFFNLEFLDQLRQTIVVLVHYRASHVFKGSRH